VKCKAEELAKVLNRAVRFIPRMTPNASMKDFRLSGRTVQASGYSLGCLAVLPGGLNFDKPVCIDAKMATSVVNILKDDIEIEVAEKRSVRFTDRNSSFNVPVVITENMQPFPECAATFVRAPYLHQAMEAVSPFTMDPSSGKVYSGVRLWNDHVIATNYKVLAVAPVGSETGLDAVLGPSLIEQFEKHHVGSEIAVDHSRAFIKSESDTFFGSLMEEFFLDHTTFVKRWNFCKKFVVKHESLKEVLPKLSLVGRDKDMTSVRFKCGDGRILMSARNATSDVVVDVPAETIGTCEFRLNIQLVAKWFRSITGLTFEISYTNGEQDNDPIRFEGTMKMPDDKDVMLTAYVIPMNLEEKIQPAAKEAENDEG